MWFKAQNEFQKSQMVKTNRVLKKRRGWILLRQILYISPLALIPNTLTTSLARSCSPHPSSRPILHLAPFFISPHPSSSFCSPYPISTWGKKKRLRNVWGRCHLKWEDLSPKEGKVLEPGQDKAETKKGKKPCRPGPGQRKTLEVKHRILILVLRGTSSVRDKPQKVLWGQRNWCWKKSRASKDNLLSLILHFYLHL